MQEGVKAILSDEEAKLAAGGAQSYGYVRHTVGPGDTLSGLAYYYRTTIGEIMWLNPIIKNPDLIIDGWVLLIPDNR